MVTSFHLETVLIPAEGGGGYRLTLKNLSAEPVSDFRLCVSGPARIGPIADIEGGVLADWLSNHAELAPLPDFTLEPGASWTVTIKRMNDPLKHWTDGVTSAYLALADGRAASVQVATMRNVGDNAPLKRGAAIHPVPEMAPVSISVIPWPQSVKIAGNAAPPAGLFLHPEGDEPAKAAAAFTGLADRLFPAEGIVRPVSEAGLPVTLAKDETLTTEAYVLRFSPDGVSVTGGGYAGLLYGLITLGQILRGARLHPGTFVFPMGGEIQDAPVHDWRGTHLDVARQFYSSAEVGRFLHILAWNKLNRFHWHLSDDEAWRVEIDAYPALTEIGAWRGHGLAIPPVLGSGPQKSGGYYTKEAVREIVALAATLGIEVMPEIDVPGHCYAMLKAIPELCDPQEHGNYHSVQGFPNNCLNPTREETYRVLETVFDELIELFPGSIFHVGADEVPLGAWSGSPQALAELKRVGGDALAEGHAKRLNVITNHHGADDIEGSGAAVLQSAFLARVQAFLASRGRIIGGWQEAAHGNAIDKAKSLLFGWRTVEASAALAGEGYDLVVCPGQVYYLDMANSTDWSEPGASWAGWSSPERLYTFDPLEGWSEEQKKRLRGLQCCIWSEPMSDPAVFDRLVFPRLSALAETAWTQSERKSFERFQALSSLMPVLYGFYGQAA